MKPAPKALIFDVFGTLVDWRASIAAAVDAYAAARNIACDGAAFADAWRAEYVPSMNRVRSGDNPWMNLDQLHAESLDHIAPRFGFTELSATDRSWFVHRWHELRPWSDVPGGLAKLRRNHVIATLSNGNVSLLVELARFGGLTFDTILSAEIFRHYKPDRETYLGAAHLLGVEPHELMLVAAHNSDLRAAADNGLQTAFVSRPSEHGTPIAEDLEPAPFVDYGVSDLFELDSSLKETRAK